MSSEEEAASLNIQEYTKFSSNNNFICHRYNYIQQIV
jgi:hypothetical protein